MRRGDLMFFTSGGHVYHVGIFLGRARDGRPLLLHAPRSGERVHRERVWTNHGSRERCATADSGEDTRESQRDL